MQLSAATFQELCRVIHSLCGLAISGDKQYLVRDRLGPLIVERKLNSFEALCQRLLANPDERLIAAVIDAVTTRETSFFRDPHVFQALLRDLFPKLAAEALQRNGPVRIWSAGTSSGQEAYSLAMLAQEYLSTSPTRGTRATTFSILASDVSEAALSAAKTGEYDAREIARGISSSQTALYFERAATRFRLAPSVRQLVTFRQINLCRSLTGIGPFDLICCRNVLIYFDAATRQRICQQLHGLLRDDGWLLLGTAENLYGIATNFESVRMGDALLYRKTSGGSSAALDHLPAPR